MNPERLHLDQLIYRRPFAFSALISLVLWAAILGGVSQLI